MRAGVHRGLVFLCLYAASLAWAAEPAQRLRAAQIPIPVAVVITEHANKDGISAPSHAHVFIAIIRNAITKFGRFASGKAMTHAQAIPSRPQRAPT